MQGQRQPRRLRLVQAVLAGTLLVPTVAACGNHYDQYANCVDESGRVVPDNYCDDYRYYGTGHYFLYMAGSHYAAGSLVGGYDSSRRISPSDSTARGNAGLPRSGHVGGTVVKSGGIGSGGSTGSHSSGKSGSGSHSSSGS